MAGAAAVQAQSDEGAAPRELLLEAARRNNTDLLEEVLATKTADVDFLNNSTDALGNTALHVAAQYGSLEVLDQLLDQEGLEVDPLNKIEQETPLHKAVEYATREKDHGLEVVEMLIDAGADPRIRNKQKRKPLDLADPRNEKLRAVLQKAEYAIAIGTDVVVDSDEDEGPASDSD
ncbi:hypothetical protein RUND412_008855 [Rhizina undulata]